MNCQIIPVCALYGLFVIFLIQYVMLLLIVVVSNMYIVDKCKYLFLMSIAFNISGFQVFLRKAMGIAWFFSFYVFAALSVKRFLKKVVDTFL